MTNMIQNAKGPGLRRWQWQPTRRLRRTALCREAEVKTAPVEIPKDTANGDYTTTFAWLPPRHWARTPRRWPRR